MTGRQGRKRKHLLDDRKKRTEYWKLKEEAIDGAVCRTRFGMDHGHVRQTTECMHERIKITTSICFDY